jgi:hypothetical protein
MPLLRGLGMASGGRSADRPYGPAGQGRIAMRPYFTLTTTLPVRVSPGFTVRTSLP